MKLVDRVTQEVFAISDLSGAAIQPQRYQLLDDWIYTKTYILPAKAILASDGMGFLKIDGMTIHDASSDISHNVTEALIQISENYNTALSEDDNSLSLPSPLMPLRVFDENSGLNALEEMLGKVINKGYLHEICNKPRMDIRYDEELLPISRAKKLASSAHRHLSAHSECWQQRTLLGIQPKKIMSMVSEDEANLYENRVYARLLDKLYLFLSLREKELVELQKNIEDALNLKSAEGVYYKLSRFLYQLWGETFEDDDIACKALDKLEQTIENIREFSESIQGLRQHGLYRLIPRESKIPERIHITNILSHDQNYRHLVRLWNGFYGQSSRVFTPSETLERNIKVQDCYSHYCGLILLRALKELNFEILEKKQNYFALRRENRIVKLSLDDQLNWIIQDEAVKKEVLKFVPLATSHIKGNSEPATLHINGQVIIPCYISSDCILSNPIDIFEKNCTSPLVLSPLDFYGVEKIISILSYWLWKNILNYYAVPIEKMPDELISFIKSYPSFKVINSHQAQLVKPLSDAEYSRIDIFSKSKGVEATLAKITLQHKLITELSCCPICHHSAIFTPWDNFKFQAKCTSSDCGVEWKIIDNANKEKSFSVCLTNQNTNKFENNGRWRTSFRL
jgi:hypothetical protein